MLRRLRWWLARMIAPPGRTCVRVGASKQRGDGSRTQLFVSRMFWFTPRPGDKVILDCDTSTHAYGVFDPQEIIAAATVAEGSMVDLPADAVPIGRNVEPEIVEQLREIIDRDRGRQHLQTKGRP